MPNQNWVWGVYIYHKYWDNTRFRQKKLHAYDFQVRLWVAAFLAFLVLKFWKCGKMWPSISKWTYTCQKNLKIQVQKYSAFDLAFLTFVGLFKILLGSLRSKKWHAGIMYIGILSSKTVFDENFPFWTSVICPDLQNPLTSSPFSPFSQFYQFIKQWKQICSKAWNYKIFDTF